MPKPDRRTSRAPASPRRPGDRRVPRATRPAARPSAPPDGVAETGVRAAVPASRPRRSWRPRMTGRAAVLVLVLAVLTVSYASSLKAYLQQRQHISELKAQIAQSEADIASLEREKNRWHDTAYVQSQARARFGYLMPGETSYVVLGADGKPLESQTELLPRKDVIVKQPTAWWDSAWQSVVLAGNPPAAEDKPDPLAKIGPPQQ